MLDKNILSELSSKISEDAGYISEIVDKTVEAYTKNMDEIMLGIKRDVVEVENPPISTVEKYFLELSNCIYFVASNTEKVGVYDGVSKANAQESYNNAYITHQASNAGQVGAKKPTVAESTAYAEGQSLHESMMNEVYNRSYKIIKAKVSSAETMISTLSKIISRRMSENQFSVVNDNKRQILNETYGVDSSPF